MKFTKGLWLMAGLVSASLFSASLVAKEEGAIRVCVDNYPPFQILVPGEAPKGEHIAALELFAALLERRLEYITSPNFARCLHMLENGGVDLLAGLYAKPEREVYSDFLPYRSDGRFVFISQKTLTSVTSYEDLTPLTIAISRQTEYFERFDKDVSLHKVETNDVISATNMLLKGRFDLLIVSEVVLPSLKARFSDFENKLKVHPYSYEEERQVYFAVSKRHQIGLPLAKMQALIGQAYEEGLFMREIERFAEQNIEYY
ncbi:substrate-binding periplasmic protein [Shewanella marisflavi]|uniref:Solute-binding protein family 3/N-terminal domain-containing protein n=1 Tax=Shewanella marisflavi TaxID=260364 RepID=A0AAC9U0D2_9GAMM|nr:transporter substrate-binding domain-containing protein [Shewanella marisflavi]ASJ97213.1 hypothetical protein CFF01_11805 [Shewanella marisflavi]